MSIRKLLFRMIVAGCLALWFAGSMAVSVALWLAEGDVPETSMAEVDLGGSGISDREFQETYVDPVLPFLGLTITLMVPGVLHCHRIAGSLQARRPGGAARAGGELIAGREKRDTMKLGS